MKPSLFYAGVEGVRIGRFRPKELPCNARFLALVVGPSHPSAAYDFSVYIFKEAQNIWKCVLGLSPLGSASTTLGIDPAKFSHTWHLDVSWRWEYEYASHLVFRASNDVS